MYLIMKENEKRLPKEEEMVQMCIDPVTGKDITAKHIHERLIELEKVSSEIIKTAKRVCKENPNKRYEIYEKYYWEIHQKLGVGSIGPATAAAGPLMYDKMDELASALNIPDDKRIS